MKFILRMTLLFAFHLAFSSSVFGQTQLLDGDWQFSADRGGVLKIQDLGTLKDWRVIRVPFSWNSQFEDLRDYRGVGWYRRTVNLGAVKTGQAVLLKFGAVDYLAEVFINGKSAGQHEGGFLPFTFEIEKLIKPGANEIAVRVTDPDNDKSRWGDLNYNELPHGKQSWYVQTGGIWQSVTLTIKPQLFIKDVKVTAKIDGKLTVRVRTSDATKSGSATAGITDPRGRTLNLGRPVIDGGEVVFNSRISNPELWSISKPNLYKIEVRLGGDRFHDQFGFRSFEARDGKLYLNGEPIYIISALDQDFYPEGIYTPPSYEFLLDQMRKARALGLNMLRTHIKVPTPDYLRAADETGVLIWYEIPSWDDNTWTPAAARRGEEIFLGQLERDWNHPSIVIQTIINEAWGVRGLREEHTRKWLKEAFLKLSPEAAKAGRLTVDNSPCCGNFHIKSDLADYHQYNSIPDNRQAWDKWVADFASRPAWLWSRNGDAEPTGKEPLILSRVRQLGSAFPARQAAMVVRTRLQWPRGDQARRNLRKIPRFQIRPHVCGFQRTRPGNAATSVALAQTRDRRNSQTPLDSGLHDYRVHRPQLGVQRPAGYVPQQKDLCGRSGKAAATGCDLRPDAGTQFHRRRKDRPDDLCITLQRCGIEASNHPRDHRRQDDWRGRYQTARSRIGGQRPIDQPDSPVSFQTHGRPNNP